MCHLSLTSFSKPTDFSNVLQVFIIRSFNLGSQYLVHTWIMEGTYQPDMCHLTLTSFSWSTDMLNLCKFCVIRSVSPFSYNLDSPYLVHTLFNEGTYQPGMHQLTLTSLTIFDCFSGADNFIFINIHTFKNNLNCTFF